MSSPASGPTNPSQGPSIRISSIGSQVEIVWGSRQYTVEYLVNGRPSAITAQNLQKITKQIQSLLNSLAQEQAFADFQPSKVDEVEIKFGSNHSVTDLTNISEITYKKTNTQQSTSFTDPQMAIVRNKVNQIAQRTLNPTSTHRSTSTGAPPSSTSNPRRGSAVRNLPETTSSDEEIDADDEDSDSSLGSPRPSSGPRNNRTAGSDNEEAESRTTPSESQSRIRPTSSAQNESSPSESDANSEDESPITPLRPILRRPPTDSPQQRDRSKHKTSQRKAVRFSNTPKQSATSSSRSTPNTSNHSEFPNEEETPLLRDPQHPSSSTRLRPPGMEETTPNGKLSTADDDSE